MSCTMHVVSTIISHSKAQKRTGNSSFPDIIDLKKTISVAEQWITRLAKTTPKTLLNRACIVQPKIPKLQK